MMPIKIQCSCGQRYVFDTEPVCVVDSVVVSNEAYNRLYEKMRSVNTRCWRGMNL